MLGSPDEVANIAVTESKAGMMRPRGSFRRALAVGLCAIALGMTAAAAIDEPLDAAGIEAAVAGNSLAGYWQNAELKQHFARDGTALRQRERREVVAGRWQVDRGRDLLCTDYPTLGENICYRVHRQGRRLVLFEAETGYPLHASVIAGNILSNVGRAAAPSRDDGRATPGATRTHLTRDDLFAERYAGGGTVHNGHFMPVGAAGPARQRLRGRLTVADFALLGRLELGRGYEWFPGFEVEAVSEEGRLLFSDTGLIMPTRAEASLALILSPGRVWSEPGDGGLSRASFPFLLANIASDNAHNGIATFLYGEAGVSSLRVQLVQETAPAFKLDAWGQGRMSYRPGRIAGEAELIARHQRELAGRTPIRPWSELVARHGAAMLEGFDAGTLTDDLSVAGLIVDGTAYVLPCRTRRGPFPYCTEMRHGASTMTPSLAALPALLRLAEKYGAWILDLRLANLVEVTARHDGWARVKFADALNMASGIGTEIPQTLVSPETMNARRSFEARSARAKLDWIFADPDAPAGPGEAFRFREGDILVLAAAMDGFVRREDGPETGIWQLMTREVLQPIGIAELPLLHSVEQAGEHGIPPMHTGLYPTIDDIAKVVRLLQERGRHAGQQFLYPEPLDEILDWRRERGLPTDVAGRRYVLSFWLWPYEAQGCRLRLPVAAGAAGQLVILMPNGIAAFRFADDRRLPVEAMATVADRLRPFCP